MVNELNIWYCSIRVLCQTCFDHKNVYSIPLEFTVLFLGPGAVRSVANSDIEKMIILLYAPENSWTPWAHR